MSFPTTSVLDNFNRADGALGANWSAAGAVPAYTGGAAVVSNQCSNTGVADDSRIWAASVFGPNSEAYFTFESNGGYKGVILRLVNANTTSASGYMVLFDNNFYRIDNNVATSIGTYSGAAAWNTGVKLGASIVGSTLTAYQDTGGGFAALTGTVTDATYSAAGGIGFYLTTTSPLDDFGGGTVGGAATHGSFFPLL